MIKAIEYKLKHNLLLQSMYKRVFSAIFRFIGLFVKMNKKQMLFFSMSGKSFGDSPRVLFEAIKTDPFFKEFELIWAFEEPDKFSEYGLNMVKLNSLSYFITAMKSQYWITNISMERGLSFKPKTTIMLNTWHGIPLKLIGNGYKNRNDYDYSDVDFMCCSGQYDRSIYINGFKVRPEALRMCGMPRNDILYTADDKLKKQLRMKYGIEETKTVILYVPTFRDIGKNTVDTAIKVPIDFNKWKTRLGGKYVVLARMHYHTTKLLGVVYNDFVVDCTNIPNISDLYIMADILISDYSSSIIDYSILERPVISYAYDKEEYAQKEGFFEPLEEALPGMVFETEDALLDHIINMDKDVESRKAKAIKEKYIQSKGNATEECIKFLKDSFNR